MTTTALILNMGTTKVVDVGEGALIERVREGDTGAFRTIVERYERRVFWIAHHMVGSWEAARDIGQEAFIRVFRNIRRFDTHKNFYTWLYQIVVNLSIDHLRRNAKHKLVDFEATGGVPDDRHAPVDASSRAELRARVQATLDRLPPKYKAVLALRDLQGFSCQEIADIVGCNNATARWRLHRARRLFKALWVGEKIDAIDEEDLTA